MKINFKYSRNPHQDIYHDDRESKFLHLSGGYASGKSFALVMKAFQLSWANKNLPGGLLCPSYSDYRRDIQPMMEEILDNHKVNYRYNKNEHWWMFPWSRGKLWVTTAENKLRGPNWAFALINELTLIPMDRYRDVIGRVRLKGASQPQVASCGTPEGLASQYYDFFVDKPRPGSRIIYGSTKANRHNLSEDYITNLEASYDSISLQAYLEGQFVNMNGKAFYFAYHPLKNDRPNFVIPNDCFVRHISIDFNVDPMCAAVWVQPTQMGPITCVDQVKLSGGNGFDTRQLAMALKARGYDDSNSIIYPDPAGNARSTKGQPDIQILRQEGFTEIRVKSSAPRLRQRQLNVNNLLEKGLVLVDPIRAPDMKRDLMAVQQDAVTLEKIKDNAELTHFSDGMDYMLDILFPWSGKRSEIREARVR